MNSVRRILRILIEAAQEASVPYAIVGGIASGVWGRPRYTADVDAWCAIDPDSLERLFVALETRGFAIDHECARNSIDTRGYCRLPFAETFLDIFSAIGPFGESILSRRRSVRLQDRDVWLASPEDLILLKSLSDRVKDHEDLPGLLAVQGQDLDRDYIERWSRRLAIEADTPEILLRLEEATRKSRG